MKNLSDMSKQDELNELKKLAKAHQSAGTYTGSLLSDRLLRWFEGQMADDVSPDIMDLLDSIRDRANDEVAKARQEEKVQYNAAEGAKFELNQIKVINERIKQENESLIKRAETAEEHANFLYKEGCELDNKFRSQAAEILRLKARMYDLEHIENEEA